MFLKYITLCGEMYVYYSLNYLRNGGWERFTKLKNKRKKICIKVLWYLGYE